MDTKTLFPVLENMARTLIGQAALIPVERKTTLENFAMTLQKKKDKGEKIVLNFICTHNSRRSHIAQIWAQAAAHYYGMDGVTCLSGGTEATAFNPNAIEALKSVGFEITQINAGANPLYEVRFSNEGLTLKAFSKKYDDAFNGTQPFFAVMTCSDADENCPIVIGAEKRVSLTYDDPKRFDGTPQQQEKYLERVHQIGRELLYTFSKIA